MGTKKVTTTSNSALEYFDDHKHLLDTFSSEEDLYDFFIGLKIKQVPKDEARSIKRLILRHMTPKSDLVKNSYDKKKRSTPGFSSSRQEYEKSWTSRIEKKIDTAFADAYPIVLSNAEQKAMTDEQFKQAVRKMCDDNNITYQDFDLKYYRGKSVESVVESILFVNKSAGLNITMNEPWLYSYWDGTPKPPIEKKKP